MRYFYYQLSNDLRVGIVPIKKNDVVSVVVCVNAGSGSDPESKKGLAHFLEHMFFKGTKKRPELTQLEREIERLGGSFDAYTTKEFTWFAIKLLKNDLEKALEILGDALKNSLFLEKEINKEKQVILEEINIYNDSPSDIAEDLFDECLFGSDSTGWGIMGKKETINRVKRADIVKFFKEFYVSENIVVSIAGDIESEDVILLIEKYFSDIPKGRQYLKKQNNFFQRKPKISLVKKNSHQVQIVFGARAFSIGHADHYVAKLIAIILGGNMSARLFKKLREESGIVYDIRTMSESRKQAGYIATFTGMEKKNIIKAVQEILSEYKKLKTEKISDSELEDAKKYLINRKIILCEDSYFAALDIAKRIIFKKSDKTLEEYKEKISKISAEDIQRVSRGIFVKNNLNLAIVGPIKKEEINKLQKIIMF